MPTPGEHKTVQARILTYAQEIGWRYVTRAEAERRRGFTPNLPPHPNPLPVDGERGTGEQGERELVERARTASLYFGDLLHAKVREFNPKYKEAEAVHEMFAKAFNAGDLEAVMALYEPAAILAPQPGQVVRGHAAIREALRGFLAITQRFTLQAGNVMETNDIALLCSKWALKGTDPQGNPVELAGQTADVVRRQSDGTWLLVIDNPWGA